MTSRNLLNLGLLVFIIILVSLVVFEPGNNKPITPPTLTNLNASDIHNIKITVNHKSIELNKSNTTWRMLSPYTLPANSFRIESINKLLSAVSLSQNNLSTLNPKEFGLDQPTASITFNNNTQIEFGNNKSLKGHRYVKIDSALHMIADTFYYQLAVNPESFIDHSVLPKNSNIIKLTLPSMQLTKNDGKWSVSPKAKTFSADSVNQLMSEWQLSQAYDVEVKTAKPKTKADVIIQLENNETLRFKIENKKDKFILNNIDNGVSYLLSKDRKEKLLTLSSVETAEDKQ